MPLTPASQPARFADDPPALPTRAADAALFRDFPEAPSLDAAPDAATDSPHPVILRRPLIDPCLIDRENVLSDIGAELVILARRVRSALVQTT